MSSSDLRFTFSEIATKKKLTQFFIIAVVLGSVCTLITYPGIFYSDSYGRWFMASEMARFNFAVQDDWLSVVPQLFMAVLYKLTQNYASFTLLQSILFFFTCFCAINFFVPKGGLVAGILFAICPTFYGFSVYVEMSVGCLVAMLWLLMLICGVEYEFFDCWPVWHKWVYFILCFGLYFVMLGFRQNAFTVLPVFAIVLWRICHRTKDWLLGYLHTIAVVLSFVVILSLPTMLNYGIRNGTGSMSTGFLWETVTMLEKLDENPEYQGMLDYLGEEGITDLAIQANHADSIYGYHTYIPNTVVGSGDNAAQIRSDYFTLMFTEPLVYWDVKMDFWARTLGMSQPLSAGEYDYNRDDRMAEFGFSDTERREDFHQSYVSFMESAEMLRTPWIMFLLALGVLMGARYMKAIPPETFSRLRIVYGVSVFYYASFLITTQSHEFRYFFIPLVLLYIVIAGSVGGLVVKTITLFKKSDA